MRNELMRASLYRRAGRDDEAARVETEILDLLAQADAGHPVVRQLTHK
jgi:hypothetical protein